MSVANKDDRRITFLISSLAGGGAEGVCVNIANGLAEKGWQIDLVVLHLNNAVYLDRVSSKVNLVTFKVNNARYGFLPLKKYIKENQIKKILVFNFELAVLLVLIRKLSFLKFKIIARNINTLSKKLESANSNWWRNYFVAPMIRRFYFQVDHIINQCKAMEQDLLNVFPMLIGRTSVIYNPVNKTIEDAAKEINFSKVKKQNYLLCVGRLEEQKAFHYAIQAFAGVVTEHPDLRLKIVGQGSLENPLRQLAKDLNISGKVDFEGFQKDMIPYYLEAKATLLTSLYEGFPNVLIESITLGTPVVAFDCPSGPSEIIEDGVNGYLVKLKNIEEFKKTVLAIVENKIAASSIVSTANQYFLDKAIDAYQRLLKDIGR